MKNNRPTEGVGPPVQRSGKADALAEGRRGCELDAKHARGLAIARRAFVDYAQTFKALAR